MTGEQYVQWFYVELQDIYYILNKCQKMRLNVSSFPDSVMSWFSYRWQSYRVDTGIEE